MRFFCIALSVLLLASIATAEKPKLHVDKEGKFRIAQLTDLHYGEGDESLTYKAMKTVIETGKADFVAFTGDMVAGYTWDHSENWFEKKWREFTRVIDETHVPMAMLWEITILKEQIIQLDIQHEYSYTQMAPNGTVGASNFVVPIYEYGSDTKIAFNLWFFDSMSGDCMGFYGYGCVEPPTIQWYVNLSKQIEEEQGHLVPGIAFFHIPTPEFMYAWNHYNGFNRKYEDVCCSSINSGLVANVLMRKDIKAIYVGHDHSNDFIMDFNGLSLVYGRKTGDGCYGPAEGVKKGGRLISVSTDSSFKIDNVIINIDGEFEEDVKMEGLTDIQEVCGAAKNPRFN